MIVPTLNEVQLYNTEQLCRWLAQYSDNTTDGNNRTFNDQTVSALRGQLIDGNALFNYPSARSIQCSGVQRGQAQRLFELIQQIKTTK